VVARDILDASMHRREERIRDVFDDQADTCRLTVRAPQHARRRVVAIAKEIDCVVDALGEFGADFAAVVDDARDRSQADLRNACDVLHRGSACGKRFHIRTLLSWGG
jgi:hypothetical protein